MTTPPPDTVRLASEIGGDGPLVVLLHGITENRHSFDPLLASLREHFRVLAVDLRGHGQSPPADSYQLADMAADVAAVVEPLGETPLVIGHSLGGIVASVYAATRPVSGVVNIDQSLDLAAMQGQITAIEPMLRSDAFGEVMAGLFGQMEGALPAEESARLAGLRRPVQDVVLGIWAPLLELSPGELVELVDRIIAPRSPYPFLAVHGIDPGVDYPEWLQDRLPGATLESWGSLGHYPHLCLPERFVMRVREFAC